MKTWLVLQAMVSKNNSSMSLTVLNQYTTHCTYC